MSAFTWYVLILTVIYMIYYGFMLAWDQYGVKGQSKNVVEEFDGLDSQSGKTRVVSETDGGGYTIADDDIPEVLNDDDDFTASPQEGGTDGSSGDGEDRHEEEQPADDPGDAPEPPYDSVEDPQDEAPEDYDDGGQERLRSIQEGLRHVVVKYEEEFDSSEMKLQMMQRPEYETRIRRTLLRQ